MTVVIRVSKDEYEELMKLSGWIQQATFNKCSVRSTIHELLKFQHEHGELFEEMVVHGKKAHKDFEKNVNALEESGLPTSRDIFSR